MIDYFKNINEVIVPEDEDHYPRYAVQRWAAIPTALEEEAVNKAEELISIAVDNEKYDDVGKYPLAKFAKFETQYLGEWSEAEFKKLRNFAWYPENPIGKKTVRVLKEMDKRMIDWECGDIDQPLCAAAIIDPTKESLKFTDNENKVPVVFFGSTEYSY